MKSESSHMAASAAESSCQLNGLFGYFGSPQKDYHLTETL